MMFKQGLFTWVFQYAERYICPQAHTDLWDDRPILRKNGHPIRVPVSLLYPPSPTRPA